jgi:hypothetical protein
LYFHIVSHYKNYCDIGGRLLGLCKMQKDICKNFNLSHLHRIILEPGKRRVIIVFTELSYTVKKGRCKLKPENNFNSAYLVLIYPVPY